VVIDKGKAIILGKEVVQEGEVKKTIKAFAEGEQHAYYSR
jgi:hypothetical protein